METGKNPHGGSRSSIIKGDKDFLSRITFDEIISRRTCYGLIWGGSFDKKPCVIKMIMLTSGLHYHKTKGKYINGRGFESDSPPPTFIRNDVIPFQHKEFIHRRAMTHTEFFHEAKELANMGHLGLAPQVYGYGICRRHEIHYGFILMQRTHGSLKDLLAVRSLDKSEERIVKKIIDKMHNEHGITHGDMKPSNIGIYLDDKGRLKKACLFDCQKIKHREDYSSSEFNELVEKDWRIYHKNIRSGGESPP